MPVTILWKCKHWKDFSGASADETFDAIINVLEMYFTDDDYKKKVVRLVADGESLNFGKISGALTHLAEHVNWNMLKVHCLNHRL